MAIVVENEILEGYEDVEGINLASVDLKDLALIERVSERDRKIANIRIRAAVKRLQDLGIIDSEGHRISKELPEDMREGSSTDFGG